MDSILNILANGENWRLLATLVAIYCFYVSMKSQMKDIRHSINDLRGELKGEINELRGDMNGRIDELRGELKGEINELRGDMNGRIDELKHNDIAHLNGAIEALTYALEKNGSLKHEDKEYVDKRLTH